MKIEFEDRSYIECVKSQKPNFISLTIAAKDLSNNKKTIINCVDITEEQLQSLISEVLPQKSKPGRKKKERE